MKRRKSLQRFIEENRTEIDRAIVRAQTRYDSPGLNRRVTLNNQVRRGWIANDEGLYQWARSEGVDI